ncbi:MAG: phytoene/squalene synthase family protein [Planctomycetes bacterium]|nr:phytoene/squalene synthase family protein [Planctomycetota bacterium]
MTSTQQMPISQALRYCGEITKKRARNFYYGLKLAPQPQRSALFTIYAWMRCADDLVDDASDDSRQCMEQIETFRANTDTALAGNEVDDDDPMWIALADIAQSFDVQPQMLHAMLDGQIDDLAGRQYESFEQLHEYCYRVASSVGLVCISIWGYTDQAAPELAIHRGIAFQLTNILRDYKEDYDVGRIYLPAEDFAAAKLSPQQLRDWSQPDKCRQFIDEQVQRAKSYYDRSKALDQMITPSCRPALWAMTTIYRSLLRKIQRQPAQIIESKRVRLGAWHKGMIAFRAKFGGVVTRNGSH